MSIYLPGGTVPTKINLPCDNETDTVMREIKGKKQGRPWKGINPSWLAS